MMKKIAIVFGVLVVALGVIGLVNPATLLAIGQAVVTPVGLYVVAGVRLCIGAVLLLAASASRMPRTVRVAGAFVVLAGIATPIFGLDRSRAVLDWLTLQGPGLMRADALLAMAVGFFILYAIGPIRHSGPSLAAPR
jgi:hypothetical protein